MTTLNCIIYKSLRKQDTYLFILREDDFSDVPEALLQAMGKLEKIMELELTPQRKMARGEALYIMEDLKTKGFHLQMPPKNNDTTAEAEKLTSTD